jgi:Mg-chelatase subunit ChlD
MEYYMADKDAILAKLSEFDFIFVGDKSGSMGEDDMPGGQSRWNYMQETAIAFARDITKIDADGIGVIFFGGNITSYEGCGVDAVKAAFAENSPRGTTPLAEALEKAFSMAGKSDKKDFIIVFTDGAPNDKEAAKKVIRDQAARQQADDDCTVLFVQVGTDGGAAAFLKELDDSLNAKFDIVDTKSMAEAEAFASTAELIYAAIND